ncbi:MAG: alpha/beta fold hydrolase [Gemmatimonadales bacterium]
MNRARRILLLVFLPILIVLIGVAVYVGTSITGRGGRPVAGVRGEADAAGRDIVYYVRRPVDRPPNSIPVVLLASFARSVSDFNELTASLVEAGYLTIAIEARGIGGSDGGGPGQSITLHDLADDIAIVEREVGFGPTRRAHLVGHAFGNRVVRTFARDRPERVASLTLIAAGGLVPISAKLERAVFVSSAAFFPPARREAALRFAFFSEESEIPDDWTGGWWLWGGLAQMIATASTPSDEFWDAGTAQMLVIQAQDDRLAPPEDSGLRLLASFPDRVELVMVPDAGHAFLPEQPDWIRRALLDFIGRREREIR